MGRGEEDMVSQVLSFAAGALDADETEVERLRSVARGLLSQIGPGREGQLSPQGRRLLYRLALWETALGVWVERYGLPEAHTPALG
jgi:hypothetical protein